MDAKDLQIYDEKNAVANFEKELYSVEEIDKKITKVKNECKQMQKKVGEAKNIDYKGIIWNNTSDAIDALQDATVSICDAQSSSVDAIDLLFLQNKKIVEVMHRLMVTSTFNSVIASEMQKKIEMYIDDLKENGEISSELLDTLIIFKEEIEIQKKRALQLEGLENQLQSQRVCIDRQQESIKNLQKVIENQNLIIRDLQNDIGRNNIAINDIANKIKVMSTDITEKQDEPKSNKILLITMGIVIVIAIVILCIKMM